MEILEAPLACIHPSPTNPRKTFNPTKMEELTASIAKHGVAQPILVRPHPSLGEGQYELVAGERRWRGSQAAGKQSIPVFVRALSDVEVLEIQVIENLQRDDLHPLEEAQGYQRLLEGNQYDIDTLISKISKSRAYIYGRMKLCELTPELKQPFLDGEITQSVALLLARIPLASLQIKAYQEVMHGPGGQPMSARAAAQHIQSRYMLKLADAPFPRADATLYPDAGKCHGCVKRTGNQKEVFEDIGSADVCTDPECFGEKRERHYVRTLETANAEGLDVLSRDEQQRIFPYGVENAFSSSWYPTIKVEYSFNKTVGELIEGHNLPSRQAFNHKTGKLVEIVKRSDFDALMVSLGKSKDNTGNERELQRKAMLETKYRERVHREVREKLIVQYENDPNLTKDQYVVLANAFFLRQEHENQKRLAKLWMPDTSIKEPHELIRAFQQSFPTLPADRLCLLLMDMSIIMQTKVAWWNANSEPEALLAVAQSHNIDPASVRKQLDAEQAKPKTKKTATTPS